MRLSSAGGSFGVKICGGFDDGIGEQFAGDSTDARRVGIRVQQEDSGRSDGNSGFAEVANLPADRYPQGIDAIACANVDAIDHAAILRGTETLGET